MSLEYRDVSAAAHRIASRLTTVASTHGLVPLSILAALSIVAEGSLFSFTAGADDSPAGFNLSAPLVDPIVRARAATVPSTDLALSSPQAARAADDRWQAARRVCQEMQELQNRGRVASVTPYSICVKERLHARLYEDSML